MSKRSYKEFLEDSDSEQEALIVEEVEKWKNKLNTLRRNKRMGSVGPTPHKHKMAKLNYDENLSNPSTSRGIGNSSWFEADLDSDNNTEEEITIEVEEGADLMESVSNLTKTPLDSKDQHFEQDSPKVNPLDPQIETLLGKEGLTEPQAENLLHPSLIKKWSFILTKGLSDETNRSLLAKYTAPSNCPAIKPPDLNPEIKINMKKEALVRDERQKSTQSQISTIVSAVGQALTKLLNTLTLTREDTILLVELLSDAGRLLADVHFKNSNHRRLLVLGMGFEQKIRNNIKEVLFNAPIDEYLFGNNLTENLDKAKALEKNSLSLLEPNNRFPKTNLNSKGPSQPQKQNRIIQKRRDGPTSQPYRHQPSSRTLVRHSQHFKYHKPSTGKQERANRRY